MAEPKFPKILYVVETNDYETILICFNDIQEINECYFDSKNKCAVASYQLQETHVAQRNTEFVQ